MILVDFSQTMISNLMVDMSRNNIVEPDLGAFRCMVLSSLRSYKKKFGAKYGEMILCCDSSNTWRKSVFPNYKVRRKTSKKKSEYNWDSIHSSMNVIIEEAKESVPYRVVACPSAEADDVIAILAQKCCQSPEESIMIVSGDKDFGQLQSSRLVKQWQPVQAKHLVVKDADEFLREHIIRGDVSDSIPNCLSGDDSFSVGKRQTPMRETVVRRILDLGPADVLSPEQMKYYERNRTLISFESIPEQISSHIISNFKETSPADRSRLWPYLVKNKLRDLIRDITYF